MNTQQATTHFKPIQLAWWFTLITFICIPFIFSLLSFTLADGEISGRVFRDFNANGVGEWTTGSYESGVPGVKVSAYDNTNTLVQTTTTGSDGTYVLTSLTTGTKYRIEFTGLQTGDFSGAFGSGAEKSGSSIQFASGGAVNVNFGINYPAHYSFDRNPSVATSIFASGKAGERTDPILFSLPHNAEGDYTSTVDGKVVRANAGQIGSVWGLAYARRSKKLYVAAFTKRHVGFGPSGEGGVYEIDMSGSGTVAPLVTVPDAGTVARTEELPVEPYAQSRDPEAFDAVGKTSLGDIDISDDEKFLYVVNLNNRRIYRIDLANPSALLSDASRSIAIPNPGCTIIAESEEEIEDAAYRPFALKYYRGKLYVGIVCSNEANEGGTRPYADHISRDRHTEGMNASVWVYDVSNWQGGGVNFEKVLEFPLTYRKEPSNNNESDPKQQSWYWNPWTSTLRGDRLDNTDSDDDYSPFISYPQPMLTDIEFDVNGDMVIGLRDRFGDQMGWLNIAPSSATTINNVNNPGGNRDFTTVSPGEILRARKYSEATVWSIEQDGGFTDAPISSLAQENTIHGPGWGLVDGNNNRKGGKYYFGEQVLTNSKPGLYHGATSAGGLALLAGSDNVVMTSMDPANELHTGGLRRLVNSTGASAGPVDGAYLYNKYSPYGDWGKANGMGDIELLTDPAPVEVGNRVWLDSNADGIQGPDEVGIADVIVELWGKNESNEMVKLATATTDANGNYIFSNDVNRTSDSDDSFLYGIEDFTSGEEYEIRIPNLSTQAALSSYVLTLLNQGVNDDQQDYRDSDGEKSEDYAVTSFTLGAEGNNLHCYDFGFTTEDALPVTLLTFDAVKTERGVHVSWSTASELNSAYFEVETSGDSKSWKVLGKESARGKGNSGASYFYDDLKPVNGMNYYRLRMVDRDGSFAFSRIKSVRFGEGAFAYPNPTSDFVLIQSIDYDKVVEVKLVHSNGQVVYYSPKLDKTGIPLGNLPTGTYLINLRLKTGEVKSFKVVKR
jgi:hypothetical protein